MTIKHLFLIISFFCCALSFGQTHSLQFVSTEVSRVEINKRYTYLFDAKDSAGNSIQYAVKDLPPWLSYNPQQHSVSGVAPTAGQYPVNIIGVTEKDTAKQCFMLTVYNKQTTNILCLGNSLTNGTATFNSYRRYLWKLLHGGNYNFDFIGSWSKHHGGGEMPNPDFDLDHEGHSGWTFEDVLKPPSWDSARGNLHTWLNNYNPDIVLIELGTNDVFHCRTPKDMFGNLNVILYLLREKNKHVRIFIAQIPPLGAQWSDKKLCGNDTTYAEAVINLNKNIVSYAAEHSTAQSSVIVVDEFTGVNPATDMYDDIHPNTKGEAAMAQRWFDAIKKYLKKI